MADHTVIVAEMPGTAGHSANGGAESLPAPAVRALAEAEARRNASVSAAQQREINGRGGLEPVRYGDWEVKGLTSDF